MRNWILKIHLYGALLCSSYFVIFGITSIHFNHRFDFLKSEESVVRWERQMDIENIEDNQMLADTVRDRLGLMGWAPWWRWSRDEQQNLTFWISRPAKTYRITVQTEQNLVQVEEHRTGVWSAIQALHAMKGLPNSALVPWWGLYLEIASWMAVFASLSGLWLWISSRRDKIVALVAVSAATLCSMAMMLYVYVWG